MAKRRSSLGFLGMFGRSGDLRQLDDALRKADLHPALVPEGVKLTIVNLMNDNWPGEPPVEAYASVARLCGYCVAGPEVFEQANGREPTLEVERRIEAALDAGGKLVSDAAARAYWMRRSASSWGTCRSKWMRLRCGRDSSICWNQTFGSSPAGSMIESDGAVLPGSGA